MESWGSMEAMALGNSGEDGEELENNSEDGGEKTKKTSYGALNCVTEKNIDMIGLNSVKSFQFE